MCSRIRCFLQFDLQALNLLVQALHLALKAVGQLLTLFFLVSQLRRLVLHHFDLLSELVLFLILLGCQGIELLLGLLALDDELLDEHRLDVLFLLEFGDFFTRGRLGWRLRD